jgi:endonuclease/exonuclease/phosphatase family metal-dependent hydrolase
MPTDMPPQDRPSGAATRLRVLTLNAHQGFNAMRRRKLLPAIREALRASCADLVFLQEVGGDHHDAGPEQHYEMLAEEVWPQHAYGRNAIVRQSHQGNALLSKHPIVSWRNIDVSVGSAEPRGLLYCVIDVAGATLHAVCAHLGLREAHRRRQVDQLIALITCEVPAAAPLIVAGDFNDWRGKVHQRLAAIAGLQEICSGASGAPARTFPAWCPLLRIDRIYTRNLDHHPLPVERRPWAALSDHVPVAAEISLQRL